jgi:hypothetical protein
MTGVKGALRGITLLFSANGQRDIESDVTERTPWLGFALLSGFISANLLRMRGASKQSRSIESKPPYLYRSNCQKVR